MRLIKIGLANANATVGAFTANVDQCVEMAHAMASEDVTVALFPELARTLDEIVASDLFLAAELPQPREEERKPPKPDEHPAQRRLGEGSGT